MREERQHKRRVKGSTALPLRRLPLPVWLMAAVLLAAGVSALMKGKVPDLVGAARARYAAWTEPPRPEATIWQAVDAAKAGHVEAYLTLFAPSMRAQLEQSRREMGEAAFRDYLIRTASEPKGIALAPLDDPQAPSPASLRFRIEFVFQDRNEVQEYTLQPDGQRWQIARVDGAERIKTLIPYGTPVQEVFGR